MPLTALDARTALVLVDLQRGVVGQPLAHPAQGVLKNARVLADAFRARGLPVVLVNVDGIAPGRVEQSRSTAFPAGWDGLVPELGAQPGDHRITKKTWGAFTGTGLAGYLKSKDVTQIVLGGVSTSIGVESTARQAYELGFNVTLALDAMTDVNADAHANSVARIFPRLGETGDTSQIVALLPDAAGERTR